MSAPFFPAPPPAGLRSPATQRKSVDSSVVDRPLVVLLSGPTGVGKTQLALRLAAQLPAEILSADSMQVYQGMDIGTAKATLAERAAYPHHLIDLCQVTDRFSVADYYQHAQAAIEEITARGHLPIVCGGTGFYLHALLYGPPAGPPPDPRLRRSLETEIELLGTGPLFERLTAVDPRYASSITPHDRQKIVRALEIMHLSGQRVSDLPWNQREPDPRYRFVCWFLHMPREQLYPLLDQRCHRMLAEGLMEEVVALEAKGLRTNSSASQAIGYRHCLDFLDGPGAPGDFEAFLQRFRRDTHRYAKRQFTWFRREHLFRWLNVEHADYALLADQLAQEIRQQW